MSRAGESGMVPKRRAAGPSSNGGGNGCGIRCCATPPSRREGREQPAPRRLGTADDSGSSSSSSSGGGGAAESSATMQLHYQEGHRLYAARDYAEAAAALSLAIQHGHPAKARCHNTRGASLTALERYDDAVAAFTCALVHEPGMHTAWSNRGQAQWKRGDLRAAVTDLRQASLLHPSEENAQLLEDAEAEWANPAAASSFEQALQHFASAEWEEARFKFEAALQMNDPRATRCHNGIGLCHFVEGAKEPALAALFRATEVDPSNANAWHNYAKALSESVSAYSVASCACCVNLHLHPIASALFSCGETSAHLGCTCATLGARRRGGSR
jgi:tetratricopeptide (TPR) repeat protein